jgi:GNAT superfamily N-acetyltransferase
MAEIKIFNAAALDQDEWRQLQGISRDAFASTLDRTQDEIDALVEWDDPATYYVSHVDPNFQVGKRYNANQSYSRPRVAVAMEAGEPVGFAFSAHNVSGATEISRLAKRLSVAKNYLWLREVAVNPGFQRRGIAVELGRALLKDAIPMRPPTAYVWPDEIGFVQGALERVGFSVTGEQNVRVFGKDSSPIREVRMQAKSVRTVLNQL